MTWRLSILCFALLLSAPLACDSNNDASPNRPITGRDAGSDAKDTPDVDESPDAKPADTSEEGDTKPDLDAESPDVTDVADTTTADADTSSGDGGFTPFDTSIPDTRGPGVTGECGDIEDLGELSQGVEVVSFVYNPDNDGLRTSCRDFDAPTTTDKIFKFTVAERSVLALQGNTNLTFELRSDPCGEESSILTCNPNGRIRGQNIPTGIPIYLIVEFDGTIDDSEINFQMTLASPFSECRAGQSECVSTTDVKICDINGSYETQTCPTGCDSDACIGDSCANPIIVTAGSASMTSDIAAFGNKMSVYTCGNEGPSAPMLGQEVVFATEELSVGQTITVDTTGDAIANTIVIQRETCGAAELCAHYDASGGESLSYQVEEAGVHYIIIDAADAASGAADYHVSIN